MKIGYWYLAADFSKVTNSADAAPVHRQERPEFLMVATLEPRKGRAVALEVFERLRDEGMDIGLSSVNAPDASLAVTAGYRVLSKDGDGTFGEDHGSRIPFVLPPGDSLYMAVEIPSKFKRKGSVFADIGLAQGKAGWWSNSLRVPL